MYRLLEKVFDKYKWPFVFPKIYSTMDGREGFGLVCSLDGIDSTFFSSRRGPKDVDELKILFTKDIEINVTQADLYVHGMKRRIGLQIFEKDTWRDVAQSDGDIDAFINSRIKGFKVKVLDNGFYPIFLNVKYYLKNKPLVFTNFKPESSPYNFLDERIDTFFEASNLPSGSRKGV